MGVKVGTKWKIYMEHVFMLFRFEFTQINVFGAYFHPLPSPHYTITVKEIEWITSVGTVNQQRSKCYVFIGDIICCCYKLDAA